MLPTIGLMVATTGGMIGFYIVSRLLDLSQKDETSSGIKTFAGISAAVAVAGILVLGVLSFDLITAAATASSSIEGLR